MMRIVVWVVLLPVIRPYVQHGPQRRRKSLALLERLRRVPEEPVHAPRPIPRKYKNQKRPQSTTARALKRPQLRVIAGSARGRKLVSPETLLRPMMGKVREAMFSTLISLGVFLPPRRVSFLDVFCGSGAVGVEALSRGAEFACFVDISRPSCDAAIKNARACGFGEAQYMAICDSATSALCRDHVGDRSGFDVVSLTPPYEEVSYSQLLDAIAISPLVNEDAVVVVEYPVELGTLPPVLGDSRQLVGLRNRKYGRTVLAFYAYRPTGKLSFDSRPLEFDDRTW